MGWLRCRGVQSPRLPGGARRAGGCRARRSADFADQRRAEAAWEDYWASIRPVELTEPLTAHAGRLAGEHALGGADAVHMASLLAVDGPDTVFAAWDERLRAGAHTAGVRLAPATPV